MDPDRLNLLMPFNGRESIRKNLVKYLKQLCWPRFQKRRPGLIPLLAGVPQVVIDRKVQYLSF